MSEDVWPKYYLHERLLRPGGDRSEPWYAMGDVVSKVTYAVTPEGRGTCWPQDAVNGFLASGAWREVTEAEAKAAMLPPVTSASPSLGTTEKTVISGTYTSSDVTLLRQALDGERGDDQKAIAELGLQIVTTLLRKNRDYGGSAHKRPLLMPSLTPRQGLLVRMSDKVHRMILLLEKGSPEVNESLEDTFTDLIGYCMLWLTAKEE